MWFWVHFYKLPRVKISGHCSVGEKRELLCEKMGHTYSTHSANMSFWWWYWCRCLILRIAVVEIARITCWYTPESHFCSILWRCLNLQRESHEKLKLQYGLSMSIRKKYEVLCSLFDLQFQSTHFVTRMSYKKWLHEFQQQIPKRCNCKKTKNKSM